MIYKQSTSCKFRVENQLCTCSFPSEKYCNQTNFPPYTHIQAEVPYYFKAPDQRGRKYWRGAMRPPWTSTESYFAQTTQHSPLLSQLMIQVGQTHRPDLPLPLSPKRPPRPPPPKALHQSNDRRLNLSETS